MATRGSALGRAIKFFEDADLREAQAAFMIVSDVMETRIQATRANKTVATTAAKPKMSPHDRAVKAAESRRRNREAKRDGEFHKVAEVTGHLTSKESNAPLAKPFDAEGRLASAGMP